MRKSILLFTVLSLFLLVPASITWAQVTKTINGTVRYESGMSKTTFETPNGAVVINLPQSLSGSVITGTVTAEPSGKTEKEKTRNLKELLKYVVNLNGTKIPLYIKPANFEWHTSVDKVVRNPLELLNASGVKVAEVSLPPVLPAPTTGVWQPDRTPLLTTPSNVVVKGDALNVYTNQQFSPGEKFILTDSKGQQFTVKPICLSANQAVINVPAEATLGKITGTPEVWNQPNVRFEVSSFKFNLIDIYLTSPNTNLRPGQESFVMASVNVTDDDVQDVPLTKYNNWFESVKIDLRNLNPNTVKMEGGNLQRVNVSSNPTIIDSTNFGNRIFKIKRNITGNAVGSFSVSATLHEDYNTSNDPFRPQLNVLKTPEDFNVWANALKKDLNQYKIRLADDDGGSSIQIWQIIKSKTQRAIDNMPVCTSPEQLDESKAVAYSLLQPLQVPKSDAINWLSSFEAGKAEVENAITNAGNAPVNIEVIESALKYTEHQAAIAENKTLKDAAINIKEDLLELQKEINDVSQQLQILNNIQKVFNDASEAAVNNMRTSEADNSVSKVIRDGKLEENEYFDYTVMPNNEFQIKMSSISSSFVSWMNSFINGHPLKKSGSIRHVKIDNQPSTTIDFKNALITEISFPEMNAAAKDITMIGFTFKAEDFKYTTGGEKVKTTDTKAGKQWMPSNFKIELGDLPCKKINKVEGFTIKMKTTESTTSPLKDNPRMTGKIEYPNLTFYVPESEIKPWQDWYNNFEKNNELKTGEINYVNEKGEFLFSVPMNNVKPLGLKNAGDGNYSITVQPGNVDNIYDTKPGENLFKPGDIDKVKDLEDSLRKIKDELEQKKRERDITIDDEIKKAEKEKRDCDKELEEAKKKAAAAQEAFEKAKQKKENIEKNIGPGKTFPDKDAAKKHFGDYEKEYNDAKEKRDAAHINLTGLKKKCPELTKALEKLRNRKTEALPAEIEKGEKDVKELGEELEREKTKAEDEKKRLEDEQKKKEELERQKTQALKDAEDAKFRTKAENIYLLQNIHSLGLISSKIWEIPGLMDWLPDALEKPIGDAVEDLGKTSIPLDAITAIGGLYNVVAAMLDPCTAEGSKTTIRRLKGMKNSKTGLNYTYDEAMDKTERMCELLKKLKAIAAAAKK